MASLAGPQVDQLVHQALLEGAGLLQHTLPVMLLPTQSAAGPAEDACTALQQGGQPALPSRGW